MASSSASGEAHDSTVMKVDSRFSPPGNLPGEKYLALGIHMGMRKFELQQGAAEGQHERAYEYVGYVLKGQAELDFGGGQVKTLHAGDSFLVPARAMHAWKVTEGPFESIEVTAPPSILHDRDVGHVAPGSSSGSSSSTGGSGSARV